MSYDYERKRRHVLPWLLVVLWICVIWGHSLMSGSDSGAESQWFVDAVRKTAYGLYRADVSWVKQLIIRHPRILTILYDSDLLHFYIRKGAHFSEYLVLAMLVFNAARKSFAGWFGRAATIVAFWIATPCIDETIQRFVPDRAGNLTDVMIDMGGFGTGLALCLVIAIPVMLVSGLLDLFLGTDEPCA